MPKTVVGTELPLPLYRRGKVRDVYDLGDELLIVASDRISAFDVVMTRPVPGKGEVLTLLSAWWFERTSDLVHNHLISVDPDEIMERYPTLGETRGLWSRRSTLVRKTEPLPVECVVRGYLAGSAWKEYRQSGTLAGEPLPRGLEESGPLPEPVFSPATKATSGDHDENIPFSRLREVVGAATADLLRELSLALYQRGREVCGERGLLLADTKFEFGLGADNETLLIDELLTPDSSRFWPADLYRPGRPQPSLDKQPLRDQLDLMARAGSWNGGAPGPELPDPLIEETSRRYRRVFERLTGVWPEGFIYPRTP
ncbi:MAG: phosphoribosylaminoimidazolesuccinocarboxamide synthase [Longimicrobiaceae bacterium]